MGVVFIEKIKSKKMEVFDFSGKKVDIGRESSRLMGEYEAIETTFNKDEVILQINDKFCDQSFIGKEMIINIGTIKDPMPFVPVYFCEAYTLGRFNSDIAEMLSDLLSSAKRDFQSNWKWIEIKEDSFDIVENP